MAETVGTAGGTTTTCVENSGIPAVVTGSPLVSVGVTVAVAVVGVPVTGAEGWENVSVPVPIGKNVVGSLFDTVAVDTGAA